MSDSLQSSLGDRVLLLIERIARLARAADHAGGLNPAQAEALRYLARANRFSRHPAALAAYMSATRGTASQTLIALEEKGLIERRPDPRDGRGVLVALTKKGEAKIRDSATRDLAAAIEAAGEAGPLAVRLEGALRAALDARGGRAFGVCRTCRHFRPDQRKGRTPHHCALLNEPLGETDARAICVEQEAA